MMSKSFKFTAVVALVFMALSIGVAIGAEGQDYDDATEISGLGLEKHAGNPTAALDSLANTVKDAVADVQESPAKESSSDAVEESVAGDAADRADVATGTVDGSELELDDADINHEKRDSTSGTSNAVEDLETGSSSGSGDGDDADLDDDAESASASGDGDDADLDEDVKSASASGDGDDSDLDEDVKSASASGDGDDDVESSSASGDGDDADLDEGRRRYRGGVAAARSRLNKARKVHRSARRAWSRALRLFRTAERNYVRSHATGSAMRDDCEKEGRRKEMELRLVRLLKKKLKQLEGVSGDKRKKQLEELQREAKSIVLVSTELNGQDSDLTELTEVFSSANMADIESEVERRSPETVRIGQLLDRLERRLMNHRCVASVETNRAHVKKLHRILKKRRAALDKATDRKCKAHSSVQVKRAKLSGERRIARLVRRRSCPRPKCSRPKCSRPKCSCTKQDKPRKMLGIRVFKNPRIDNLGDGGGQPNNARMCCNGGHTNDAAMVNRFCKWKGYKRGTLVGSKKAGGRVSCAVYRPGHSRRWDGGHGCHFSAIRCVGKVRGGRIFRRPRINNLRDGGNQPNNAKMCCNGGHTDDSAMVNRYCQTKGFRRGVLGQSTKAGGRVSCAVYRPGHSRRWDGGHGCHFSAIKCIDKVPSSSRVFASPRINNLHDGAKQPNNVRMCCKGGHTNDAAMVKRYCNWKGYHRGNLAKSTMQTGVGVSCAVYRPGHSRRWDGRHGCHFTAIVCEGKKSKGGWRPRNR